MRLFLKYFLTLGVLLVGTASQLFAHAYQENAIKKESKTSQHQSHTFFTKGSSFNNEVENFYFEEEEEDDEDDRDSFKKALENTHFLTILFSPAYTEIIGSGNNQLSFSRHYRFDSYKSLSIALSVFRI